MKRSDKYKMLIELKQSIEIQEMFSNYSDIKPYKVMWHKDNDKQVKVIAGKFEKAEGPVKGHNVEPIYFDVELNKDKEFSFNLPSTHNSFIYLISGEIYIGEKKHNKLIDSTLILLDKGEILKVRARSNSKFLLISGKPINCLLYTSDAADE